MSSFTISNWIALSSVCVSLISLAISILTGRKAKNLDLLLKQQQIMKHNQEETDNRKANMEVCVVVTPQRELNVLRFSNKGKAIAHNVAFDITSDKEDHITLRMREDFLPYPMLQPNQSFDVRFINCSIARHQTIEMTWDDDFGKARSKVMVVDL